jgi:dTDP-4-amino-4,6-dideoxygalactose transaminase
LRNNLRARNKARSRNKSKSRNKARLIQCLGDRMEFRDLKAQYKKYKNEIDSAIQKVLENTNFIDGEEVKILEKRLAQYVGVKHCISCANGTEAMTLAMMAWDIKEGDAVFVPDFTFFSTGEIVSLEMLRLFLSM